MERRFMKIDFYFLVPNKKTQGVIYNEGVAVLSALAKKKGASTGLRRLALADLRKGVDIDPSCDIHAISFASRQLSMAKQLIGEIASSKRNGMVVAGGIHATVARESLMNIPGLDVIVSGEGEPFFEWILDSRDEPLDMCPVPNVHVKGRELAPLQMVDYVDPNTAPYPDRTIFDKDLLQKAPEFIFSRGCPFSCNYCANEYLNKTFGLKIRRKTPEYCMGELDNAFSTLNIQPDKILTFHDDIFLMDSQWLEEFGTLYKKTFSNPFRCNTTASFVTEEKARFLNEINCREIWVGVETGNEDFRTSVLKKRISNKQIIKAFDVINAQGLHGVPFIMLGCPGETTAYVEDTLSLLKRLNIFFPLVSMFTPYPGTSLYQKAVEEDNVREFTDEENDALTSSGLKRKNISDEDYAHYANLIHFQSQSPSLYYLARAADKLGISPKQLKRLQSFSPTFFNFLRRMLRSVAGLFLRKKIDFDRSDKREGDS
jgi:anaerobic magnesium-protoporphyrin IX monomethyl ester cyclase